MREIGPGVFQLGEVRLNKAERTLTFPGGVNMSQGHVEYLLVHELGKVHESVLRTSVQPLQVHLAALLLQAKKPDAPTKVESDPAKELAGPPASISIAWRTAETNQLAPGEDLIFNIHKKSSMDRGNWTYNGSRLIEGFFVAQRDGSIASVLTDAEALMNGMRLGRDQDDIWMGNTNLVPAVNTPVTITIKFHDKE